MLCKTRRKTYTRALRGVLVMAAIVCCYLGLQQNAIAARATAAPAKGTRVSPPANAAAPVDFSTIVERYGPAVVNISATPPEQQASAPVPENIDANDPFSQFFQQFAPQFQWPRGRSPRVIKGIGAGFIVSPDGLILTNAHVVGNAEEVTVKLTDRREFKAKVLAVDAQSDVAVLRIDATKLPTVTLGDSSRVRTGEPVLAIGSPSGFENTATAGIVSATPRTLPDGTSLPFIQTDVAVNPGNSGGPLFNRYGEVIGIDVQLYTQAEGYQGLTFAIPINVATRIKAQLQAQAMEGSLGVDVQDVDQGLARAFGLPRPAGALVNAIEPGTPAAASGLKPGDIITQIGNKAIGRSAEFAELVAGLKAGTKITLTLIRDRKFMTATVTVGPPMSMTSKASKTSAPQEEGRAGDRLGLAVRPLNEAEQRTSGLADGLVVEDASGPAAHAGIEPGDIILSLNGTPVGSPEQLRTLAAKAGPQVALLILHDNSRVFVSVQLR